MNASIIAPFFRCTGCGAALTLRHLPLCPDCAGSLLPCPPLCPSCLDPACPPGDCLRPWVCHAPLQDVSSSYFLTGRGYTVCKRWKTRGGWLLDRAVLPRSIALPVLPDALVPVPQAYARSWSLGHSPAERLACHLARIFHIPLLPLLAPASGQKTRQAEKNLQDRLSVLPSFRFIPRHPLPQRILLIDDFLTTGQTLRSAALQLKANGIPDIHGYTLGFRPRQKRFCFRHRNTDSATLSEPAGLK